MRWKHFSPNIISFSHRSIDGNVRLYILRMSGKCPARKIVTFEIDKFLSSVSTPVYQEYLISFNSNVSSVSFRIAESMTNFTVAFVVVNIAKTIQRGQKKREKLLCDSGHSKHYEIK